MTEGIIFDIQRYSLQDGPGLRTLVFFKGCPLRCGWCSNPESQRQEPELLYDASRCTACGDCVAVCPRGAVRVEAGVLRCDRTQCNACGACVPECHRSARRIAGVAIDGSQIAALVMRDAPFYRRSGGGVTLGGGEPTRQPEFAMDILQRLRCTGVDTALETCGCATSDAFLAVAELADHVLFDVKHAESARHAELTGVGNEVILQNLETLLQRHQDVTVRYPLIPHRNGGRADLQALIRLLRRLPATPPVELVPYHRLGEHKYRLLGREYALACVASCDEDVVSFARDMLLDADIRCTALTH